MKNTATLIVCITIAAFLAIFALRIRAEDTASAAPRKSEYATIRWAGLSNMHIIRASGEVEFVGPQLTSVKRPNRVDDRSFYLNIVMNSLAKEGYEFAALSNDDIIMRRAAVR